MFTLRILNTVLDNYKATYKVNERKQWEIDISDVLQGGIRATKILLGVEPDYDDPIRVLSSDLVVTARMLADRLYNTTGYKLIVVRTSIYNTYLEILTDYMRLLMCVYKESSSELTAITRTLNGIKYKIVGIRLQLIDLLSGMIFPEGASTRESYMELYKQVITHYPRNEQANDKHRQIISPPTSGIFADFLKDKLIVLATKRNYILISDQDSQTDIEAISRLFGVAGIIHDVRLPFELFMKKIVVVMNTDILAIDGGRDKGGHHAKNRQKKHNTKHDDRSKHNTIRLTIYNAGMRSLFPYHIKGELRYAYPSVIARFLLIEDNTIISLHAAGFMKEIKYSILYSDLEKVTEEVLPEDPNLFYGIYLSEKIEVKILQKLSKRTGLYFPVQGLRPSDPASLTI